jgi:hypothetical protein
MTMSVKRIELWRTEVANRPGTLAGALAPLAEAGADLRLVMAYRFPGNEERGAIELYPVAGKRGRSAASRSGLTESGIPTLLVEGDDRPATGATIARALAEAGINLAFLVAQVVGRRYAAVIGFDSEPDARKAVTVIKRARPPKK